MNTTCTDFFLFAQWLYWHCFLFMHYWGTFSTIYTNDFFLFIQCILNFGFFLNIQVHIIHWRHALFSRPHSLGDSRRPSRLVSKRQRTGWSTRWRWRTPTTTRSTVTSLPPPQRQLHSEFSKTQSPTVRPYNHTSTSKIVVINSKKVVYIFCLLFVRFFVFWIVLSSFRIRRLH